MDSKQRTKSKSANYRIKQSHWHEMNRKERRELMRKIQSEELTLEVVHPDAAGIDIGNESHYVAVPPTRDSEPVRRFGCTTAELKAMADWLKQCRIRTVARNTTSLAKLSFTFGNVMGDIVRGHRCVMTMRATLTIDGGRQGANCRPKASWHSDFLSGARIEAGQDCSGVEHVPGGCPSSLKSKVRLTV